MKTMMDVQDGRKTIKRYNAGIQRAKGLLELASGLYDSSLASESWKAAEGVLQTDTPIGNTLKLSLKPKPNDRNGIALSFTTGGFAAITAVAEGKFFLAWVNPSVQVTMAYRAKRRLDDVHRCRGLAGRRIYAGGYSSLGRSHPFNHEAHRSGASGGHRKR